MKKLSDEQYKSFNRWMEDFISGKYYCDRRYVIRQFYILEVLLQETLKDYNNEKN